MGFFRAALQRETNPISELQRAGFEDKAAKSKRTAEVHLLLANAGVSATLIFPLRITNARAGLYDRFLHWWISTEILNPCAVR